MSKPKEKMVSQQLLISPLLPRALLPASSLEPLEADERVLCSFERIAVAAGGPDADASAAEEGNADAVAVGTLHITSRYEPFFFFLFARDAERTCCSRRELGKRNKAKKGENGNDKLLKSHSRRRLV